jgi:phospholipid-binding lipoprotein MlaA
MNPVVGPHPTSARKKRQGRMIQSRPRFARITPLALAFGALVLLGACAQGPGAGGVHDPLEADNRAIFETNLAVDRAVSDVLPEGGGGGVVLGAVRNVSSNLSLPNAILNNLLQLRIDRAVENSFRLAVNTTIGLGGLFDPAGHIGLYGRDSDFGETLHVWGVGEGAYVVLPFLGPSTERDTFGLMVDLALLDPFAHVGPTERLVAGGFGLAGLVARRIEFSDILDANVMQSADPYAQARLLFLQTRRHHLGQDAAEEDFIDPYADF